MIGDTFDPTNPNKKKGLGLAAPMDEKLGLDKGTETYSPPASPPPTDVPSAPFQKPMNTGILGEGQLGSNGQVNEAVASKVSDKLKARKPGV